MRRHLGTLLIAAGLLLMSWPVVTWAYGIYWQTPDAQWTADLAELQLVFDSFRPAPS